MLGNFVKLETKDSGLWHYVVQDFEIDELSQEYLALHPMAATTNKPSLLEEHFEALSDEDEQSISGSDISSEDDRDDINGKSTNKSHVPRSDVASIYEFFFFFK